MSEHGVGLPGGPGPLGGVEPSSLGESYEPKGSPDPTVDPADGPEPNAVDVAHHDDMGLDLASMIAHAARGSAAPRRRPKKMRPDNPTFSSARHDDRDPQPLSKALGRLAAERGWTETVSVHMLLGRWPVLVGPMVAQHCEPESFADGVLVVRTDSTAWASQLRLMAPNILAAINAETREGAVTLIKVLGPDAPSWTHGSRSISDARGPRDTYG